MKLKILNNQKISSKYFKMTLQNQEIVKKGKAGQFIMLRVTEKYDPLLPRAFALHRMKTETPHSLEILYQMTGRGTMLMSQMKTGEELFVIGPLGNGFSISKSTRRALIIAGGIGIAPTYLLALALKKENIPTHLFVGGKTGQDVLCVDEFDKLGVEIEITTEDGSIGKKGMASGLLKDFFQKNDPGFLRETFLYACGPSAMLKSIAGLAKKHSLSCQVSMEAKMACGVGACLGCVVKTKGELTKKNDENCQKINGFSYERVCKEGPVFDSDEIIWD